MIDTWDLWVRNAANERVCPVDGASEMMLAPRVGGPGAWSLRLPSTTSCRSDLLAAGARVEARVPGHGKATLTGFVDMIIETHDEDGTWLEVAGPDDSVLLWERVCYPDPANAPESWSAAYDVRTGVPSTVMHGYVDENLGASALAGRRAGVTAAADPASGTSSTWRARMERLGDKISEIADGAGLVFRVLDLEFDAFMPTDLTGGPAKVSQALGNLGVWTYERYSPEATVALVAGQGEGAARTVVEVTDVAGVQDHRRSEQVIDRRDVPTEAELRQAGTDLLADIARSQALSIEPINTPVLSWPTDYDLGDRITALVGGVSVSDVVREVVIRSDAERTTVTPHLGRGSSLDDVDLYEPNRKLARRVEHLEGAP